MNRTNDFVNKFW